MDGRDELMAKGPNSVEDMADSEDLPSNDFREMRQGEVQRRLRRLVGRDLA